MSFLATPAYAQSATGGAAGGMGMGGLLAMMVIIFGIFYVLTVLPTRKKEKAHKAMLAALQKGDKVLTIGGIFGVVSNVDNEKGIITLTIADKTKVDFTRSSIQAKIQ
jgi:preprotein translocase subunit YajC